MAVASLAATSAGLVAAWAEGGEVRARRHDGTRWSPLGARINEGAPAGPVRATRTPDGGVAVAWVELGTTGVATVRFARWDGRRWSILVGPLNAPTPGDIVTSLAVAWAGERPMVTMTLARQGATLLRNIYWTGMQWDLAGPPSLISDGMQVRTVSTASCEDGTVLLAWIEVGASGTPGLTLRRWNAQIRSWDALPRGNAPLVDGSTQALGLACGESGEPVLAYGWSGGTHPVRRWNADTLDWDALGLPRDSLGGAVMESGPWLMAQGDALWMVWRATSGRLSVAVRRGGAWGVLSEALDEPGDVRGEVVVDAENRLYVSTLGPARPMRVARFTPE